LRPLTVWVFEAPLFAGDPSPVALADVDIAFDPPRGGERQLLKTGVDGSVVVEGDFSNSAGAAITASSIDHVIATALDASPDHPRANRMGKPTSDVVILLPRNDSGITARSVSMRGQFVGKTAGSVIDVSTNILPRLGNTVTDRPNYGLRAPRAKAFTLIAHEQTLVDAPNVPEPIKSFRIDLPARDADDVLFDLDITNTPALVTKAVSIRASGPAGFVVERCSAIVHSAESTFLLGAFRRATITEGSSSCEAEITLAETTVPAPETALTTVSLTAADGSRTLRMEQGAPASASFDSFLLPIAIPEASRALTDPIPVSSPPSGVDLRIEVFANDQLAWVLDTPTGGLTTRDLVMPRPTFGFTADVTILALAFILEADHATLPSGVVIAKRSATSRDVLVRR